MASEILGWSNMSDEAREAARKWAIKQGYERLHTHTDDDGTQRAFMETRKER